MPIFDLVSLSSIYGFHQLQSPNLARNMMKIQVKRFVSVLCGLNMKNLEYVSEFKSLQETLHRALLSQIICWRDLKNS